MASIWEKAISILAGNLNSLQSYLITAVGIYIDKSSPHFHILWRQHKIIISRIVNEAIGYFLKFIHMYALSFYLTKTVFVGPKWFWSDQIDLDLTIMIWSRPKWFGQVKMWFILVENHNLDLTNSFWWRPNHYGQVQINLVRPKPFWSNRRTRH